MECRSLYMSATWTGHQGEADWYAAEVDRTLRLKWEREAAAS